MNIVKVADAVKQQGIKAILYAPAGHGKTYSITTLPDIDKVLVLSAEAGLLSIKHVAPDLDVAVIKSLDDLREAFAFLNESDTYQTVVLDSLSEIAEQVLHAEKEKSKDPRKAYGELQTIMVALIKAFRDLSNKNVLFLCKQERIQDQDGAILYGPAMPGQKLQQQIPYLIDLVFALRVRKNEDGTIKRAFQTQPDLQYECKDRSGLLDVFEFADWTAVFTKINNHKETNNGAVGN